PRLDAVAIPAPRVVALVALGAERARQLFVHGRLDRDPDLHMNQLPQRGRPLLTHRLRLPDTLRHGAFLRRPSWRTAGWWLNFPPEECAISRFSTSSGTPPRRMAAGSKEIVRRWWSNRRLTPRCTGLAF